MPLPTSPYAMNPRDAACLRIVGHCNRSLCYERVAYLVDVFQPSRMSEPDDVFIEAKVTRYNIARLRLGQVLVPLAVIAAVVAQRAQTTLAAASAFALLGIGFAVFLSAAKRLGWQPLRFEGAVVSFGATGLRMERKQVREWTLIGDVARLYARDLSVKLQARGGSEQVLGALLRSQFGSPVPMDRRGSKRARALALCAAAFGLVMSVLAIVNDNSLLAVVGAPAVVFGIAVFGALSQRVAQR